ncbi:MAG: hypothetical protein LBE86_08435, partial [Gemmobacter sp.]|nr:hypothetical protein [Gemmobacter sp.]
LSFSVPASVYGALADAAVFREGLRDGLGQLREGHPADAGEDEGAQFRVGIEAGGGAHAVLPQPSPASPG